MLATLPVSQTRIVANELAAKLAAAEAAIDAAVAAVAGLTAAMPLASQQSNVGMHVGHEALMHAMESCTALVKARTNIIRSHKALAVAQHEVGLGAVAFNDTNCPPMPSAQLDETADAAPLVRHLAAVA